MSTDRPTPPDGSRALTFGGWPVEHWVAFIILAAFAVLVLIRMGYRGVKFFGFEASAS